MLGEKTYVYIFFDAVHKVCHLSKKVILFHLPIICNPNYIILYNCTALPNIVPCKMQDENNRPGECTVPWANIIPFLGFDISFLAPYLENVTKKYDVSVKRMYSCHQLVLYNLPHFYYVK